MINTNGRFLKIIFICPGYLHKFLRIAINDREPCALNHHHDAMSFFKSVSYFIHVKGNLFDLAWSEWLRIFITVSEFSAKYFGSYHSFKACHLEIFWIRRWIWFIIRQHIDQLYNEVSIGAGS